MRPRRSKGNNNIQNEMVAADYDMMMRAFRDAGQLYTDDIIKSGIESGLSLEIGSGCGYLGLEWLRKTEGTSLVGMDTSADMVKMAEKNAAEYGFSPERARYIQGDVKSLPFGDETFDAVFSNGSLHEWETPAVTFNEIHRVLKAGGRYYISDYKRNMLYPVKLYIKILIPGKMRPGLIESINAAYTKKELSGILAMTRFGDCNIRTNPASLILVGVKR